MSHEKTTSDSQSFEMWFLPITRVVSTSASGGCFCSGHRQVAPMHFTGCRDHRQVVCKSGTHPACACFTPRQVFTSGQWVTSCRLQHWTKLMDAPRPGEIQVFPPGNPGSRWSWLEINTRAVWLCVETESDCRQSVYRQGHAGAGASCPDTRKPGAP